LQLFTLLAIVVGTAISNALKPEKFVESAIGGIIDNRVDAGFVKGGKPNEQQELQQVIGRSMIAAQQSIIKDCLKSGVFETDRGWLTNLRFQLAIVWGSKIRILVMSTALCGNNILGSYFSQYKPFCYLSLSDQRIYIVD
jgi:hypothetical protein